MHMYQHTHTHTLDYIRLVSRDPLPRLLSCVQKVTKTWTGAGSEANITVHKMCFPPRPTVGVANSRLHE